MCVYMWCIYIRVCVCVKTIAKERCAPWLSRLLYIQATATFNSISSKNSCWWIDLKVSWKRRNPATRILPIRVGFESRDFPELGLHGDEKFQLKDKTKLVIGCKNGDAHIKIQEKRKCEEPGWNLDPEIPYQECSAWD